MEVLQQADDPLRQEGVCVGQFLCAERGGEDMALGEDS